MRTAFLLRPDRLHGIEQDRPPGGQQGGREPRDRKHRDRAGSRNEIPGLDPEQEPRRDAAAAKAPTIPATIPTPRVRP